MKSKTRRLLTMIATNLIMSHAIAETIVHFDGGNLDAIQIQQAGLYPETIVYNPINDKFLVGSFREGAIYEVNTSGSCQKFVDDERLKSSLGIRIDAARNRLLVATSDIGSSIRAFSGGPKKLASVVIFELSSGKYIDSIDLGALLPEEAHLANDLTVDDVGNIYVTDSFAPAIYKINTQGQPSIFLKSEKFRGDGINLNGIVFHPDGYLIVVKKSDGLLFKVPINNPHEFSEIKVPTRFFGGDGLVLINKKELVVVANRTPEKITETVFALSSDDNWKSASVTNEKRLGDGYLTTGVVRVNKLYVLHSNIGTLVKAPADQKSKLTDVAVIQQVGTVR